MIEIINESITNARKKGNKSLLKVSQLIKTEFQKFLTSSKNAELTEIQGVKILLKMKEQWNEEIKMLENAGRDTSELSNEVLILDTFIPKLPSEEDIINYTKEVVKTYTNPSIKDMKGIINAVKNQYPLADGKLISKTIKELL